MPVGVSEQYSADLQVAETHRDTINLHQERQRRRHQGQVQVWRWWNRYEMSNTETKQTFCLWENSTARLWGSLVLDEAEQVKNIPTPEINDWLFITHLLLRSLLLLEVRHSSWENPHTYFPDTTPAVDQRNEPLLTAYDLIRVNELGKSPGTGFVRLTANNCSVDVVGKLQAFYRWAFCWIFFKWL